MPARAFSGRARPRLFGRRGCNCVRRVGQRFGIRVPAVKDGHGGDRQRVVARLREDESDHRRNMIERGVREAMQRFFSKFHREQDDDEE